MVFLKDEEAKESLRKRQLVCGVQKELETKVWESEGVGITLGFRFSFGKVGNTFPLTATIKAS